MLEYSKLDNEKQFCKQIDDPTNLWPDEQFISLDLYF